MRADCFNKARCRPFRPASAAHDLHTLVVYLTEKGRAMCGPIASMWKTLEAITTRNLSPQEAESVMKAADTIVYAINARTEADHMESGAS